MDVNVDNPYLHGLYGPAAAENPPISLEVLAGEVPADLSGAYLRNGPNPTHPPLGRYHWFDGDGMVHAVRFSDGTATYHSRWITTEHYQREHKAGRSLWSGIMESYSGNPADAPFKDSANTDLIYHAGKLYALWYICGRPYQIDLESLETLGADDFGTGSPLIMSAHAKVDTATDELLFFDYSPKPPYLRYGVINKEGQLEHRVNIDVPGPRLPHDMAVTENYSILMDLPVFFSAKAAAEARWAIQYHRDMPSRFAVIPRHGDASEVRWFEAEPGYIYHTVNAWEEGDTIVMVACKVEDPVPAADPADGSWARMMANLRITAHLHKWTFDLKTGTTREERLDDRNAEFPTIDDRFLGKRNQHGYCALLADAPTLLFEGLSKYDLHTGASDSFLYGPGRFGSEAPFAPREGSSGEGDGYLVTFVCDEEQGRSETVIFDASDLGAGPVCRLAMPGRVPLGFHACWVPS